MADDDKVLPPNRQMQRDTGILIPRVFNFNDGKYGNLPREDNISLETYKGMMNDAQVRAGLEVVTLATIGSGWEFNNSDYQKNVVTSISSGYSHGGYPGAYCVCYGEASDSGDNNISQFGPGSSPNNGSGERHGNGDGSRFYEYYNYHLMAM